MLKSGRHESYSNPTSPSNVILDRTQNLEHVLRPRVPIVPETVNMENATVQALHNALEPRIEDVQNEESRLRPRRHVDYQLLHKYGRKH